MTILHAKNPLGARLRRVMEVRQETLPNNLKQSAAFFCAQSASFPLRRGRESGHPVYGRGGWSMVSNAFTEIGRSSTEQGDASGKILRSRAARATLSLPDVRQRFGSRWKRINYDVTGEWGLLSHSRPSF